MIPPTFINYASGILADTNTGLKGSKIAELCSAYAIDFDVKIPFSEYPFPSELPNKRAALKENLEAFTPEQQFKILKELTELPIFADNVNVKDLKIKLVSRYGALGKGNLKRGNQ